MTIVPSSALTSARAPRPEPLCARSHAPSVRWGVDPNRVSPAVPTCAQWDLLEYAYAEQCHRLFTHADVPVGTLTEAPADTDAESPVPQDKHPVVAVIPRSHGAISTAYADARVLEMSGFVTLSTTNERVGGAPQRKAPWLYTWAVRLTDKGEQAARNRIGRRLRLTRQRQAAEAVARVETSRPQTAP